MKTTVKRIIAILTLALASTGGLAVLNTASAGATPTGGGFNTTCNSSDVCSSWTASGTYGGCVVYNTIWRHVQDPTGQWVWDTSSMQWWQCADQGGPHPIGYIFHMITYDNIAVCMKDNGGGTGHLEFWGTQFSGAAGCLAGYTQYRPCASERGGAGFGYGAHFVNDTGSSGDMWCLWGYGPQYDPNGGYTRTGLSPIYNHYSVVNGYNTPWVSVDID